MSNKNLPKRTNAYVNTTPKRQEYQQPPPAPKKREEHVAHFSGGVPVSAAQWQRNLNNAFTQNNNGKGQNR